MIYFSSDIKSLRNRFKRKPNLSRNIYSNKNDYFTRNIIDRTINKNDYLINEKYKNELFFSNNIYGEIYSNDLIADKITSYFLYIMLMREFVEEWLKLIYFTIDKHNLERGYIECSTPRNNFYSIKDEHLIDDIINKTMIEHRSILIHPLYCYLGRNIYNKEIVDTFSSYGYKNYPYIMLLRELCEVT